ncbi:MAG: stage II sporulation protein R [Clostridia bacterium]|nr:stage II sporulation protein R [Clostridia bacterium]
MKRFWIIIGCVLLVLSGIESFAANTMTDLTKSLVRLHVRAEDDSATAQENKLKVRDRIIEVFGAELSAQKDTETVRTYIRTHLNEFEAVAEEELRRLGADNDVTVSFEKTSFNTREYGDIRLPAGTYDALNIVIGKGEGKNWWCVLFPPLCFVEDAKGALPAESEALLKKNLDTDTYELIQKDGSLKVELRFKLVELWETAKLKTALGGSK